MLFVWWFLDVKFNFPQTTQAHAYSQDFAGGEGGWGGGGCGGDDVDATMKCDFIRKVSTQLV